MDAAVESALDERAVPLSEADVPELIQMVLSVPVQAEGQMSEEEALSALNVTRKSPRWL